MQFENNSTAEDVDVILDPRKGDFHTGLAASFFVTVMSELGDKTFIMSAILAMHHSRTLTFLGSILGQVIMTGIAVALGMAASLIPEIYTRWASCICMTFFGLKMLKEGFDMSAEDNDNLAVLDVNVAKQFDKSEKINEEEMLNNTNSTVQSSTISTTVSRKEKKDSKANNGHGSRRNSTESVLLEAFTLSFLGEWGDRSQIATILLASNENPYGVAVGSFLGHVICSLMAVVGGHIIGQKFPVKTMTQVGGVVFLLCAASSLVLD